MNLVFNGQPLTWSSEPEHSRTLAVFVQAQKLMPPFACAINGQFVARTDWATTLLHENDQIEAVHPVTGG